MTGTWPPPCAGTTRQNGAPATPPADPPRLPAGSQPTPAVSPVAPRSARAAELEPGGRTPREIAEILAWVADAPARCSARRLLAPSDAILSAPAVQTVREGRFCTRTGEGPYSALVTRPPSCDVTSYPSFFAQRRLGPKPHPATRWRILQILCRSGTHRLLQGGSWFFGARLCRASNCGCARPAHRDGGLGFRLPKLE